MEQSRNCMLEVLSVVMGSHTKEAGGRNFWCHLISVPIVLYVLILEQQLCF